MKKKMKNLILGKNGFFAKSLFEDKYFNDCIFLSKEDFKNINNLKRSKLKNIKINNCLILFGVKKQHGDNYNNFKINQKIDENLSYFIKLIMPKKIIYISSTEVYDIEHNKKIKFNLNSNIKPISYYGLSKINSEFMISNICNQSKIKFLIIRLPLVYGKYDNSNSYGPTNFINSFLRNNLIKIWGKGDEYREFIYIQDFVNFIKIIFDCSKYGYINFVSGKSYSFIDIVRYLELFSTKKIKLKFLKRNKQKFNIFFTKDKFLSSIKFKFTPLNKGIKEFLK